MPARELFDFDEFTLDPGERHKIAVIVAAEGKCDEVGHRHGAMLPQPAPAVCGPLGCNPRPSAGRAGNNVMVERYCSGFAPDASTA